MKPIAAAVCLLFATSLMQAQTPPAPAQPPAAPKAPEAKVTPAPGKGTPAKAAPAKKQEKKEEELPKIPGTVITRANGNKLGLEVVDGKFKLTFYDKKHKPMAIDVTRANARWPNTRSGTPSDYRTVLNGSGTTLVGARPVFPPLTFTVYLTLLQGAEGEEAKAVESYVVPFKG
jgi:hypothetical protein